MEKSTKRDLAYAVMSVLVTMFVTGVIFTQGIRVGRIEACSSVNLEWVKDKCMKVTREELK